MNPRRAYLIKQEVDRIQAFFGNGDGRTDRTEHAIAKEFLLRGKFFYNGRYLTPKAKHIGCGVYELSASEE